MSVILLGCHPKMLTWTITRAASRLCTLNLPRRSSTASCPSQSALWTLGSPKRSLITQCFSLKTLSTHFFLKKTREPILAVSKMDLDPSESQNLDTSHQVCHRFRSQCEQCRHWRSPFIMSPAPVKPLEPPIRFSPRSLAWSSR